MCFSDISNGHQVVIFYHILKWMLPGPRQSPFDTRQYFATQSADLHSMDDIIRRCNKVSLLRQPRVFVMILGGHVVESVFLHSQDLNKSHMSHS